MGSPTSFQFNLEECKSVEISFLPISQNGEAKPVFTPGMASQSLSIFLNSVRKIYFSGNQLR